MPGPGSLSPLTVVKGALTREDARGRGERGPDGMLPSPHELEWSILMARAQDGDGGAYRRLLEEVTPYLCSLAASRHRDPSDAEDAVQDILLTIHAVRQTYDPGPALPSVAGDDRQSPPCRSASPSGAAQIAGNRSDERS